MSQLDPTDALTHLRHLLDGWSELPYSAGEILPYVEVLVFPDRAEPWQVDDARQLAERMPALLAHHRQRRTDYQGERQAMTSSADDAPREHRACRCDVEPPPAGGAPALHAITISYACLGPASYEVQATDGLLTRSWWQSCEPDADWIEGIPSTVELGWAYIKGYLDELDNL